MDMRRYFNYNSYPQVQKNITIKLNPNILRKKLTACDETKTIYKFFRNFSKK